MKMAKILKYYDFSAEVLKFLYLSLPKTNKIKKLGSQVFEFIGHCRNPTKPSFDSAN